MPVSNGWTFPSSRRLQPEFIGIPEATLQLWLTQCQTALQQLTSGNNPNAVSYAQGDGSKSVTYTQADVATLEQRIRNLAEALGFAKRRSPMRPLY